MVSVGCCGVLKLDVKNAFSFFERSRIKSALADIGVPVHLMSLFGHYLSKGNLWYGTDPAGVLHGSVLGSLL